MSLSELGLKYGTDKGTIHGYLPVYESYLEGLRQTTRSLLEIGVDKGSSLMMWREYFPNAIISGLDVLFIPMTRWDRIQLHVGNSTDANVAEQFGDESFDVIVDDGSHAASHQILTLCWFWPKLKKGGMYFIEDIGVQLGGTPEKTHRMLRWFGAFRPTVHEIYKGGKYDDVMLAIKK
jgi:demethylmacrocin O-methyltransferase